MQTKQQTYPDQYLHVRECSSGQEWIVPIAANAHLDIEKRVREWVKREFCGELRVTGFQPRLEGQYYATIITDGRPPDSVVVWSSAGFWTDTTY